MKAALCAVVSRVAPMFCRGGSRAARRDVYTAPPQPFCRLRNRTQRHVLGGSLLREPERVIEVLDQQDHVDEEERDHADEEEGLVGWLDPR